MDEFINAILGQLNVTRQAAVDLAFKKFEIRGLVSYKELRDAFDGRKHPDVALGKKTPDEAVTDFLEIFELHHNNFNGGQRTD